MNRLFLITWILVFYTTSNAQNLNKGFDLLRKGEISEATAFFEQNSQYCLSKAGILQIGLLIGEFNTMDKLNQALMLHKELTDCYATFSDKEKNQHAKYFKAGDLQDLSDQIEKAYYNYSISNNNEATLQAYKIHFPTGKYINHILDGEAFLKATQMNKSEGYKYYLDNHLNGLFIQGAIHAIALLYCTGNQAMVSAAKLKPFVDEFSPYGKEIMDQIEGIMFGYTENSQTDSAFINYLVLFPEGKYKAQVTNRMEQFYINRARKEDTVESYEDYLKKYPNGRFSNIAVTYIQLLKGKAHVELEYPKVVSCDFRYSWNTTFKETGGYKGYTLKAEDFYILAVNGDKYTGNWTETVTLKPGGTSTVFYWCDCSDKWKGGMFHCIWKGTDEGGNDIRIIQTVTLK